MSGKIIRKGFIAEGTTCESCAEIIRRQAMKVEGVKHAEFDYSTETGHVEFDPSTTDIDKILYSIEEKGYKCFILDEKPAEQPHKEDANIASPKALGWVFGILGIIIAAYFIFRLTDSVALPQISQNMGYGLLFLVGILTGFHCVSMCGGFVLSYTAKNAQEGKSSYRSHIMYAIGKTVSYTIIGAAFGLLGSIIAFTPAIRGVVGILSGLFLLLFGLKMLNVFPALRKISILPKSIGFFAGKESIQQSSPLIIGLLNGLMIACGPLQAVYVMAAGTGSMIEGAKLLFVFALGTLPVMLGFGYLTTFISSKLTHKILKASGVIVMILGLFMINNGLALTGTGYDLTSIVTTAKTNTPSASPQGLVKNELASNVALLNGGFQEIHMTADASGYSPNTFILKKGVPVKWIIDGKVITGCNKAIQVPKLSLSFDLKQGEQTIDFTPTESGTIPWSCWMGMLHGTFIVKDDISDTAAIQKYVTSAAPAPKAGTCGGSGGGCGCGMMS